MMKNTYPASLLCDFYKVSHKNLYPQHTEVIYSTFTARSSRHGGNVPHVVAFGIQAFVQKYLVDYFNTQFFGRPKQDVLAEYTRIIKHTLGVANPDTSHLAELHDLGYLPIRLRALKEGTLVPIKVPMLTIENTDTRFFWLTNYLETLLSTELWQPITSATKAKQFRDLLDDYAMATTGGTEGVDFQGHDFSMRGMSSLETAQASGAGHLLSFAGTDTIPSILYLEEYYAADVEKELVGASVVATEHSIMSSLTPAGSDRDEYEAYKYLITEASPTGIMSIVSDTYDFWQVIGNTLPRLKEEILARDGTIVIRPDSGIPEDILCGSAASDNPHCQKGLVESLWDIFGGTVNELGYKVLDPHIGAIYGDAINLVSAQAICERLKEKGFASTNVVFGLGSFFYQFNTRDTFGFAMKATYAQIAGEPTLLFKDPKTDDGTKRSLRGKVLVLSDAIGDLSVEDGLTHAEWLESCNQDEMDDVFVDGQLVRMQSLSDIRGLLTNSSVKEAVK